MQNQYIHYHMQNVTVTFMFVNGWPSGHLRSISYIVKYVYKVCIVCAETFVKTQWANQVVYTNHVSQSVQDPPTLYNLSHIQQNKSGNE